MLSVKQAAFGSLVNLAIGKAAKQLDKACEDCEKAQTKVLETIMKQQSKTDKGKEWGLATMSAEEFTSKVPVTTYEDYKEQFEEVAKTGEWQKVTSEPIIQFMETSGTTGNPKIYPMTRTQYELLPQLVLSAFHTFPIPMKNRVNLSTPDPEQWTECGVPKGQFINLGRREAKSINKKMDDVMCVHPVCCNDIDGAAAGVYVRMLFALANRDVELLFGNYATTLLSALQFVEKHWGLFVQDISNRSLGDHEFTKDLSPTMRAKLNKRLRRALRAKKGLCGAAPCERAETLRNVGPFGANGSLEQIWPSLRKVICITPPSMRNVVANLRKYLHADTEVYSFAYIASEGMFAVNLTHPKDQKTEQPTYCVHPGLNFLEFLPESEETPLKMWEVKEGESYEMLVTNRSCLYRYRMGDLVKVVGFNKTAPVIQFLERKGESLNLASEKTSEEHVAQAVKSAFGEVSDYCVCPNVNVSPMSYTFFVEGGEDLDACALDEALGEQNVRHKVYREKGSLGLVEVVQVLPGTFSEMQKRAKTTTQYKPKKVITDDKTTEWLRSRARAEESLTSEAEVVVEKVVLEVA